MNDYRKGDYLKNVREIPSTQLSIKGDKLIVSTNTLDCDLAIDLNYLETMIKEAKLKLTDEV